jgi:5-dehydro-2-deoxygluconokinase
LKVALITRVGDEQHGRFLREQLVREGVDVSHVHTDPKRATGIAFLAIRDKETFPAPALSRRLRRHGDRAGRLLG